MVVVKIEIWPHGDESKAREIGRAQIANVGGTADVGEYECRLAHAERFAHRSGWWKIGKLSGFKRRTSSPYHLVMLAFGATLLDK